MRAPILALALLLALLSWPPSAAAEDFGAVGKVNNLINVFETPQLAPGESGVFRFELNSTYAEPIYNVTLSVGVYMYATIEEALPVDDSWGYPYPQFRESDLPTKREVIWTWPNVANNTAIPLNFTVDTALESRDMPHGSVFSQATYFVRFRLEFDGNASGTWMRFLMASRGFFTEQQWTAATNETNTDPCNPPSCRGNLNLTFLTIDGRAIDGLLPDSSFGVKEPIPRLPFYVLVAGAAGFLVLAFLFWVEENPGTYPRVEAWWARTKGRFVRTFRLARRRRPAP